MHLKPEMLKDLNKARNKVYRCTRNVYSCLLFCRLLKNVMQKAFKNNFRPWFIFIFLSYPEMYCCLRLVLGTCTMMRC